MRLVRKAAEEANLERPGRVATGVDVIGDLAIIRLDGLTRPEKKRLAEAILKEVKNVAGVFDQEGGIEGEYRLRTLKHLAGEERTMTLHRENGCVFKVDVAKCYFSPRLSTERLRIAKEVTRREKVLNMFAGVGPFSIPIARSSSARVTSCEINELACTLHEENDRLNKVDQLVEVIRGDALELPARVDSRFDRVLMPHPSQADRFLPTALALTKKGGLIHYYRHVLGRDDEEATESIRAELSGLLPNTATYQLRRVRAVGPRWVEMAADVRVGA
ncbi:MAG: class I SAM-dependent methyltransferase family protein [Thaumarchaeota archaeon]|nr:class I SAM-dependent methyltransferase family protein [Nitrososphaerota archaeon]